MSPQVAWAVVVGSGALASMGAVHSPCYCRPFAIFRDSADAYALAESMLNRRARVVRIRIAEDEGQ